MKNLLIRDVVESDINIIENIAVCAFSIHYEYYRKIMGDKIFEAVHKDWKEKKMKSVRDACLHSSGLKVYIAETDNQVVGFVTLKIDQNLKMGTILNNSVLPEFQGKGIGKSLYEYVLNVMNDEGMQFARVDTGLGETFAPARSAYEKSGFDKQLRTVSYYMEL